MYVGGAWQLEGTRTQWAYTQVHLHYSTFYIVTPMLVHGKSLASVACIKTVRFIREENGILRFLKAKKTRFFQINAEKTRKNSAKTYKWVIIVS